MSFSMTPQSRSKLKLNENSHSPFVVPPTPLLHRVGYGTGASVYRMDRSPRSGLERSPWALKKINRKNVRESFVKERLQKEADILKSLNHPNIVGFRGFTKTEDGREVLVMEECTQSLGDLIEYFNEKELECMTPHLIVKIVNEVGKALHYLHTECKLIHGDIKSFNILIKDDFKSIKICDFGVSIRMDSEGACEEEYIGTICWAPPEVVREDGPVTAKADIFALGLTIYEMLTLQPPYIENDDFDSTMDLDTSQEEETIYGKRLPLPSFLGPKYSNIIELYNWCTEEDCNKRPSAKEILKFIEDLMAIEDN